MRDTDSQAAEEKISGFEYNPGILLDTLCVLLKLKTDGELAKTLDVAPSILSKIRCRRIPVGAIVLIRMHEVSGLTIAELRWLMGERRQKFRLDYRSKRND